MTPYRETIIALWKMLPVNGWWRRVVDNWIGGDLRRFGAEAGDLANILLTLGVPSIVRCSHAYPNPGAIAE
jgi:hypothetical protein